MTNNAANQTFSAKLGIFKGKKNKEYSCLEIAIHPEYNKRVFLDESENVLIKALGQTEFVAIMGSGIGKESGLPYQCLDIEIATDCTKKVFLERAELALIKLNAQPF